MRGLLVTAAAAALMAVGCGDSPASQARPRITVSAQVKLTVPEACQRLRADVARNGGAPGIPVLRDVADHVTAPRFAADARTAVRDIGHTGIAPVALTLLRDDCARAGVRIPAP